MKRMLTIAIISALFAALSIPVSAGDYGTAEEAKALVETGAKYFQKFGNSKGLAEVTRAAKAEGKLVDRDLYIFAYDFEGVVLAHGANPKLIGRNLYNLKDTDGKFLIRELIDAAKAGNGWVDYKWSHPKTKKIMPKTAFVQKIDDGLWIGCGTYTK
jgi:signal transduction histidine kinase